MTRKPVPVPVPVSTSTASLAQRLLVGMVLLCLWGGFVTLLTFDLKASRDSEYETVARDAGNLTRLLERQLGGSVEKIDIVLREAARDYAAEMAAGAGTMGRAAGNRDLMRRMEVIPEAQDQSLRIINVDGIVVWSAGNSADLPKVHVGDRAYFLRQKADPDAGLVISEPILSRFSGKWVMTLSRRLPSPDGRFIGLAQAAIRADMIQSLFESLNLGRNASVALYDTSMRLIARHPVDPDQLGKSYPLSQIVDGLAAGRSVGSYSVASRVDGVEREYTYRKMDGLPFVLLVGLAPDDFLAAWWRKALFYAISLLAMTVELAGLLWLARKFSHDRISYLVSHDSLTDLPNRLRLEDHLAAAAPGSDGAMALLALDLDHFKNINDTLGHDVGDRLLRALADRLRASLRDTDTVTRQGGDEFVVLLKGAQGSAVVAQRAGNLLDTVARPFLIDGHELVTTASIGIALYPTDGADVGTLLQNADTALHQAKAAGRNAYQFFASEMNDRVAARLQTESGLRKALPRNELMLHYQPQFQTSTRELVGFEALLRWKHPEAGVIAPGRFIPIAEETGLIVPIGEWVLREACRQNKAWQDQGLAPVVMAVNLSAVQFRQNDLVAMVRAILEDTGLEPRWLELEVTESVLMHDIERVIAILHELKALGVKLSIDDFGTGYSSLSYLKRFPIDKIKIDQSFVREVERSSDDAAIVQAVIAIASRMGMRAIAEGVETGDHFDCLHSFGCDEVQGFLFSPAVAPDEALRFFHDHPPQPR
ncbi:MAG: putative bifunctional diguanylate cyclase/phosphodiesterase [Bacteroidota bacterium]